jgi:hypothetical protein
MAFLIYELNQGPALRMDASCMQEKELLAAGHKSISSGALVCDSAKIFLTSMFSYLLLSNPTHKTKNGTANR